MSATNLHKLPEVERAAEWDSWVAEVDLLAAQLEAISTAEVGGHTPFHPPGARVSDRVVEYLSQTRALEVMRASAVKQLSRIVRKLNSAIRSRVAVFGGAVATMDIRDVQIPVTPSLWGRPLADSPAATAGNAGDDLWLARADCLIDDDVPHSEMFKGPSDINAWATELAKCRARRDALVAVTEAVVSREEDRIRRLEELAPNIQDWLGKSRTVHFDTAFGRVAMTKLGRRLEITDQDAAAKWIMSHEKARPLARFFRGHIQVTGEAAMGVKLFSIMKTTSDGGKLLDELLKVRMEMVDPETGEFPEMDGLEIRDSDVKVTVQVDQK